MRQTTKMLDLIWLPYFGILHVLSSKNDQQPSGVYIFFWGGGEEIYCSTMDVTTSIMRNDLRIDLSCNSCKLYYLLELYT